MRNPILTVISLLLFSNYVFISCQPEVYVDKSEEINLHDGWMLQSSNIIDALGDEISKPGFQTNKWYETNVPSTVLAALVSNEVYQDIFVSDNLKKIPKEQFEKPWWYRKEFNIEELSEDSNFQLVFEGINYKANIWLNGELLASKEVVEQPFRMFRFIITEKIKKGKNCLAVEIIPPVKGDLTIGYVDWNPWPPDNNMGIWRPVKLLKTNKVSMKNVFVKPSLNTETMLDASLSISAVLTNHTDSQVTGEVNCEIEGLEVKKEFTLQPNETRKIELSPTEYSELNLKNPRIWWPVNLGDPNLYNMTISAIINNTVSDKKTVRFGIRDVKDYINEDGFRGYMINGEKILIRGAGWVDDILLNDTDEKVKAQVEYVKHMNLNTIRLEGFWGRNKKIYEYADENGLLIMIGWSCQWEWENYCGRPEDDKYMSINEEEFDLHARAYKDQVFWLRNHPSVFLWVYGSDKLVPTGLEKELNQFIALEDGTRRILGSCAEKESNLSGPTAVKMRGPYSYVTPNYWYEDTLAGGAFGFNTETGPGLQPSPLESIKKMIPEDHLWPIDNIWEYHLGRNEFATFKFWMKPFKNRYGEEDNLEDFTLKAQMANYEAMRPMLEAFAVNKHQSTGVIQWMLNSAMPGMLWQLYDWYLMPNGAFYGAKTACRPLNIVYNYKDKNIYLTNEFRKSFNNLQIEIKVLDINSKEVFSKSVEGKINGNSSILIYEMPALENVSTTYFLDLKLKGSDGTNISNNFYWLSTKDDICDYENSKWFITENSEFADLKGINTLAQTELNITHNYTEDKNKQYIEVSLENDSDKLAFFIELTMKGKNSGLTILPVFWEDNYVSVLPGEKKVIKGYYYKKDLEDDEPLFSYKGWNVTSTSSATNPRTLSGR